MAEEKQHFNILRAVLERLSKCRLEPTPANFSLVYREVSQELGYVVPQDMYSDMDAVLYTLNSLDGLLISNDWLSAKIWELKEYLQKGEHSEQEKKERVKIVFSEILDNRDSLLLELGKASLQFKESMGALFQEVEKLTTSMTGFESSLSDYNRLLNNCFTIDDAKSVLTAVLFELDKVNKTVGASKTAMSSTEKDISGSFSQLNSVLKKPKATLNPVTEDELKGMIPSLKANLACLSLVRFVSPEQIAVFDEHVKEAIASSIRTTDILHVSKDNTVCLLLPAANFHSGAIVMKRIRDRASGCRMDGTLIAFNLGSDRVQSFAQVHQTAITTYNSIVSKGGGFYPPLDRKEQA